MRALIKSIFSNYDILSINGEKNPLSINLWQKYNIRLESWGTDYDTPISLNQEDSLLDDAIDLNVECDQWVGRQPSCQPALPNRILFVDGPDGLTLVLSAKMVTKSCTEPLLRSPSVPYWSIAPLVELR